MNQTSRERAAQVMARASWPDGGHDGFPTTRVALILAAALDEARLLVRDGDES